MVEIMIRVAIVLGVNACWIIELDGDTKMVKKLVCLVMVIINE